MNSRNKANPVKVLVSFQDSDELAAADGVAIDIFDLKAPQHGPLGRPDLETAIRFIEKLKPSRERLSTRNTSSKLTSLALGEFHDWTRSLNLPSSRPSNRPDSKGTLNQWIEVIRQFDFAKFGFSNIRKPSLGMVEEWHQLQLDVFPTQLVPVWYADFETAHTMDSDSLFQFGGEARRAWSSMQGNEDQDVYYMLVDTYQKPVSHQESIGLLEFVAYEELRELVRFCASNTIKLLVAGSVRLGHLESLHRSGVAGIGVRGAVSCEFRRRQQLDRRRLREFVESVKRVEGSI